MVRPPDALLDANLAFLRGCLLAQEGRWEDSVPPLHEALSPAERALAKSAAGAAKVQEFHRQLFANSADFLRQEIKRITGVDYHTGHVWKILRSMDWSLQRPARRAVERDEEAIARWVKTRWPQVKKTPGAGGRGSSSATSRESA